MRYGLVSGATFVAAFVCATRLPAQSYRGIDLYTLTFEPPASTSPASGGQVVGTATMLGIDHAALNGPGSQVVDLNPTNLGFIHSYASGTNGAQQVGKGSGDVTGGYLHALLWNGTANSAVDLHPTKLTGFNESQAIGTDGVQQVGFATTTGDSDHALLWSGSADSAVDLHPTNLSGFNNSQAFGTDGVHQVGEGGITSSTEHALLWTGNASSAVDLNPLNFRVSVAYGVNGSQQVGLGYGSGMNGASHALLWTGTASSAVDLSPTNLSGFEYSRAMATNGTRQVGSGFGSATDNDHALLWSGTADSAIDLHLLLPGDFTYSEAYTIDANGDVFGIAADDTTHTYHAVEWMPLPEPAGIVLAALGFLGIVIRCPR